MPLQEATQEHQFQELHQAAGHAQQAFTAAALRHQELQQHEQQLEVTSPSLKRLSAGSYACQAMCCWQPNTDRGAHFQLLPSAFLNQIPPLGGLGKCAAVTSLLCLSVCQRTCLLCGIIRAALELQHGQNTVPSDKLA